MMARKKAVEVPAGRCGECAHVETVTAFHTLSVHGRKPTLGRCPYVEGRCVLLSELSCKKHFKKK